MGYLTIAGPPGIAQPPDNPPRQPFSDFGRAIEATGQPLPKQIIELRDRYSEYINIGSVSCDELAAAVVAGRGDWVQLRQNALVDELSRSGDDAAVSRRVQDAVLQAMQDAYAPHAVPIYRKCAAAYDAVARRLTAAHATTNIEANGESLIAASQAQRDAWLETPALAAELDVAHGHLLAAASLVRNTPEDGYFRPNGDVSVIEQQVPLFLQIDPKRVHRRRVWEAITVRPNKLRGGMWSQLLTLGVTLKAARDPLAAGGRYDRPVELVPVVAAGTGGVISSWDPHSSDLPPNTRIVRVGWEKEIPNVKKID